MLAEATNHLKFYQLKNKKIGNIFLRSFFYIENNDDNDNAERSNFKVMTFLVFSFFFEITMLNEIKNKIARNIFVSSLFAQPRFVHTKTIYRIRQSFALGVWSFLVFHSFTCGFWCEFSKARSSSWQLFCVQWKKELNVKYSTTTTTTKKAGDCHCIRPIG